MTSMITHSVTSTMSLALSERPPSFPRFLEAIIFDFPPS